MHNLTKKTDLSLAFWEKEEKFWSFLLLALAVWEIGAFFLTALW